MKVACWNYSWTCFSLWLECYDWKLKAWSCLIKEVKHLYDKNKTIKRCNGRTSAINEDLKTQTNDYKNDSQKLDSND